MLHYYSSMHSKNPNKRKRRKLKISLVHTQYLENKVNDITVRYLVRNVYLPATNLMHNTIGIVKLGKDVYVNLSGLEK